MSAGKQIRTTYLCTQWLFLRALGLIYFLAFVSVAVQVNGLIGSNGILPAHDYLAELANYLPLDHRMLAVPTLAWYNSSDGFLQFLCWGGALAGLGVLFSVATAPLLIVAWVFYLSLMNVGQDFLSFQWDSLLLEAGFLAMFWSPWQWLSPPWRNKMVLAPERVPFKVVLWLYRWLLFRLMFLSGSVKLLSQDPTWRNLTALQYHYFTQPLPTPLAWLMNQMPDWCQSLSVAVVFLIELAVPFLFFLPRRFRYVAAALTVLLQLMIMLTGNYTFFNLLTIALCIPLLDDSLLMKFMPKRLVANLVENEAGSRPPLQSAKTGPYARAPLGRRVTVAAVAALVVMVTIQQMLSEFAGMQLAGVDQLLAYTESFHIASTYGLFAVMTTTRPEISVEGSNDGVNWTPYTFKFKPGPLDRPPPIVAPFQPRLDWQMWFAALGPLEKSPWFAHFVYRLLQGSPDVVQLLQNDPFQGHPPTFIRANLYDYRFTNFADWQSTHNWWKRTPIGEFMPPVSLKNFRVKP